MSDEPYPPVMYADDLARLLRRSVTRVRFLAGRGEFDAVEILPRTLPRRYSGKKVQAWIEGQPIDTVANAVDGGPRLALPGRRRS